MTYITHSKKAPAPGHVPKDRFDIGKLREIIELFENYILAQGEDRIEKGKYVAPTYSIFLKCWREIDKHNLDVHKSYPGKNEHNTDDANNTPSQQDAAEARANLADVLFKLQHAAVNATAMEATHQEDEMFTL